MCHLGKPSQFVHLKTRVMDAAFLRPLLALRLIVGGPK